jgi:gentisate 1,2-dioxygenase
MRCNDVARLVPWTPYYIETETECVLFSYSESAAQEAPGLWREENPSNASPRERVI